MFCTSILVMFCVVLYHHIMCFSVINCIIHEIGKRILNVTALTALDFSFILL